ncbi:MAG: hypothetical protein WDW36_002096 [Sanguina aurantia]
MTGDIDPSTKMLRSGFGRQVKSFNQSNPSWGFGTGSRDAFLKLYLSQEQAKAMNGNNSQGAVYKNFSAIGPQPESKYLSATAPGFGTAARKTGSARFSGAPGPVFGNATRDTQSKVWLDDELMKTYAGRESPGPNSYKPFEGIGKQVDSKYGSAPSWRQGTSERFRGAPSGKDGDGSAWIQVAAIGKQAQSNKQTLPSFKIGTGQRDAAKKLFISKEHEKGQYGENSPGPVTGQFVSSIGIQTLSVKSSAPSWGFGTGKRIKDYGNEAPGPGAYFA